MRGFETAVQATHSVEFGMSSKWTILILGTLMASGCYGAEDEVAEMVFRGGVVWTGEPGAATVEAVMRQLLDHHRPGERLES